MPGLLGSGAPICREWIHIGLTKRACGSRCRALFRFRYQFSSLINFRILENSVSLEYKYLRGYLSVHTNLVHGGRDMRVESPATPIRCGYMEHGSRVVSQCQALVGQSEVLSEGYRAFPWLRLYGREWLMGWSGTVTVAVETRSSCTLWSGQNSWISN